MSSDPRLSIIIVNWNVRELLAASLESVDREMRLPPQDYELIVVDNASADGSVEMLREAFPDVRLIASAENLGFARGCNEGFKIARGRYILLLNPDTLILDHAIDGMLAEMEARPRLGILGCRLLNVDRSFQRASGGAFPSLRNVAWNYLFLNRLLPRRLAPPALFLEENPGELVPIDWVSGACMLIRRDALGGTLFDEGFFMFGEDMDICDRIRAAGWEVLYTSRQSIIHYHGQSFAKQASLEVLASVHKGPRRFFQKQRGRLALFCYDLILLTGFLVRWPAFRLLSLLRPKAGYGALAAFSRRYVLVMFNLITGRA